MFRVWVYPSSWRDIQVSPRKAVGHVGSFFSFALLVFVVAELFFVLGGRSKNINGGLFFSW